MLCPIPIPGDLGMLPGTPLNQGLTITGGTVSWIFTAIYDACKQRLDVWLPASLKKKKAGEP